MRRITLFALISAFAFAQSDDPFKPKPPAEVDQALRARIQEFFDLHIKAQYRKAEELVAEDTKDYFYSHDKPKFLSCEINKVDYSENFTKASAVVTCERYVMLPGFSDKPMKVPGTSTWKLVDDKWYWYVDQDSLLNTPFGRMRPGDFPTNGSKPAPPALANLPTTGDFLMSQVKMDPQSVRLKPGESAEVIFTSRAPGPVDLTISTKLAGVDAKFDHSKLKSGESATLVLTAGKTARSGVLTVQVDPTTQTLPIQVTVVE